MKDFIEDLSKDRQPGYEDEGGRGQTKDFKKEFTDKDFNDMRDLDKDLDGFKSSNEK
jgi:hypothetical protein